MEMVEVVGEEAAANQDLDIEFLPNSIKMQTSFSRSIVEVLEFFLHCLSIHRA